MQLELANALVVIAEEQGIEARLYMNYSGRGMNGRTTAGIIVDDAIHDLPILLYAGASKIAHMIEIGELEAELEKPFEMDRLGHASIVY